MDGVPVKSRFCFLFIGLLLNVFCLSLRAAEVTQSDRPAHIDLVTLFDDGGLLYLSAEQGWLVNTGKLHVSSKVLMKAIEEEMPIIVHSTLLAIFLEKPFHIRKLIGQTANAYTNQWFLFRLKV